MSKEDNSPSANLNPGSLEAVGRGCLCPEIDNRHGRGWPGENGKPVFYLSDQCPMHKTKPNPDKNDNN